MPVEFSPTFQAGWPIRHVLFDFDGTLSLVRSGWVEVMTGLFAEHLGDDRRAEIRGAILRLNGQPSLRQMEWLVEALREANQPAEGAPVYLEAYRQRLQHIVGERLAGHSGNLLVAGARVFLEALVQRGLKLHLASGTEQDAVRHEAAWLGIDHYFEGRIFGATPDSPADLKMQVIERLLQDEGATGNELLSFGDGRVETVNVCRVGGLAIGLAQDEDCNGGQRIDPEKRGLLGAAGAQVIIADYHDALAILPVILQP